MTDPPSLLQRLKNRKVFQWGFAYVAGAWLLLEILGRVAEVTSFRRRLKPLPQ